MARFSPSAFVHLALQSSSGPGRGEFGRELSACGCVSRPFRLVASSSAGRDRTKGKAIATEVSTTTISRLGWSQVALMGLVTLAVNEFCQAPARFERVT